MTSQLYDVVVVGGGVAGLSVASLLLKQNLSVLVVEANDVSGGRIRSVRDADTQEWLGDLGPSWVWPEYQPTVKKWLDRLDLQTFPQYDEGDSIIEMNVGSPAITQRVPGQAGIRRIDGGSGALIEQLMKQIEGAAVLLGHPVTALEFHADVAHVLSPVLADPILASKVVVALPPRLAAQISYSPALPESLAATLQETSTWMAPHAKVVLLYEKPFWRDRGLSGRIISHIGPIVELHDQCGMDGYPYAMTGFIGLNHSERRTAGDSLNAMILQQFGRLFGRSAPMPLQIVVKDWAEERYTATQADRQTAGAHPGAGSAVLRMPCYQNRLWYAGSETSAISPGLIEGAFAAADDVSQQVMRSIN